MNTISLILLLHLAPVAGPISVMMPTYFALTENTYAKEAEIQIKNMMHSSQSYYTRNGTMPGDCYEEMEAAGYIEIKQTIIDNWDFQCDWEFDDIEKEIVGTITATSTDKNDVGPGNFIMYDILENEFTGYGQGE